MATFLEKNKKKSALAALLLFLRARKTVTALLLLLALASFVFVSPSNFLLSFPGGARVAAAAAWLAGKVGVDTSKWGLAGGKRDYGDLLAAFRAAKAGDGKAGWGAFMSGGGGDAGGGGSLDFVKGNRKDLEVSTASGEKLSKAGSVQGVLNPDDAKNRGEGVALSEEDLAGGGAGARFLGGGAGGAAGGSLGDKIRGWLSGLPSAGSPSPKATPGGATGRLSQAKASALKAKISRGLAATHTVSGQKAFVQLAAGRGRAVLSVSPNCSAGGGCPSEFATANTGAVYDGNNITGANTGILTTNGETPPAVPLEDSGPAPADPAKLIECQDKVMACETAKKPDYERIGELQTKLDDLLGRMGDACSDNCKCDPCNDIKNQINGTCTGELKGVIDRIQAPCVLPSYCAALGVEAPPGAGNSPLTNMCKLNMGSCGCGGGLGVNDVSCQVGCALGLGGGS